MMAATQFKARRPRTSLEKSTLRQILSFTLVFIVVAGIAALSGCRPGNGEGLDQNGQPINEGSDLPRDQFASVQAIFTGRCIVCHSGAGAAQGLVLSEGLSYSAIVGVPSTQQPELSIIAPNDPEASYLVRKIRGDSSISGSRMPLNGPPYLSEADQNTIISWVSAGAPDSPEPDPEAEFIAELSSFANYDSWPAIDYSIGPTNSALGAAHQADTLTHSRRVYANSEAFLKQGDEFPNGSILVKEVTSFESGDRTFAEMGLLAMVKRGADFNPEHQGWEWFVLSEDRSEILARGADVMAGMCNACHTQASDDSGTDPIFNGSDYVFSHPSEFVAQNNDFTDYKSWSLIDTRNDDNPLLDGMAHGAGMDVVRRVYKRQLYANPDSLAQGYPIGTMIVKETTKEDEIIEITAMVKRGSDYNANNGNWEWFMLDPEDNSIARDEGGRVMRGANLMDGMCSGCHFAANQTSGHGIDFVFAHDGDPFNNNEAFVANLDDFKNYQNWRVVDFSIGATNAAIGGGHKGRDNNFSRRVFANDQALDFNGERYGKGSILVKEITSWQSGSRQFAEQLGLVAMVKRSPNFNPDLEGWEWFDLAPDLSSIIGRGADYRNGGCNGCHAAATGQFGTDGVFPHPSEFIASDTDFSNYREWTKIDDRNDQNPLLAGMAHKGDDPNAIRRVFKRELYAAPEDSEFGFPIGTVIVKEVEQNGAITELAAMVKRGGDFNDDNQNWEWFMLDPATATVIEDPQGNPERGADLMAGMCNSCHKLAETGSNEGRDYVFFHQDDPVNNSTTLRSVKAKSPSNQN